MPKQNLRDRVTAMKAKTDAGAVLMFDGELWSNPVWKITAKEISFGNSGARVILWSKDPEWGATSEAEANRVITKRLRVLVDA